MKDAPYCYPLEKIKHAQHYFYIDDGCVHADMPFYPADVAEKTIRALDNEIFEQRRTINSLISQHRARRKQLRKERHDARDALKHLRVAYAELQAAIAECSDGFAFRFWKKALARLKESDDACKARKAISQIVKAPAAVESMYGYKKAWSNKGPVVVKLEIDPATAFMVVDIAHNRMRVNQCKVVDILNLDGTKANVDFAVSYYDPSFIYCVDRRTMTMKTFDFHSRSQYARGIHCFNSFEQAANYNVSIRRFTWPLWKLKSWVFYNIYARV